MARKKGGAREDNFFGIIIFLTIIILGLAAIYCRITSRQSQGVARASVYRAVFLDNGEVYFGQLQNNRNGYLRLNDVYYFKVGQVIDENIQPDIQLMKLGSEIHQPKGYLDINRQHILFIQELAADSKILNLIQNFDEIKKSALQAPAATLPAIANVTSTDDTEVLPDSETPLE